MRAVRAATLVGLGLLGTIVSPLSISPSSSSTQVCPPISVLDEVKHAMEITSLMESNGTLAYDACRQWENVMENSSALPRNARAICFGLHAFCLVRVGQDDRALQVYDNCLELRDCLTEASFRDVILGKALALQRSMRYEEARDTFLVCRGSERACIGAATCCLRIGDERQAEEILSEFQENADKDNCVQVKGMLGVLWRLRSIPHELVLARLWGATPLSPLYHWLSIVAGEAPLSGVKPSPREYSLLELGAVNISPFDDSTLIHLDDKVLLQDLLASSTLNREGYLPEGMILPRDAGCLADLQNASIGHDQWILKRRAGYGSYGNQILTMQEALDLVPTMTGECLLQRMVFPPMLLGDRKFTMRIYVVCLSDAIYLATNGVVKLASLPYKDDGDHRLDIDDRMHMTNSGREDIMTQYDFGFLRRELNHQGHLYEELWSKLRDSVVMVMRGYRDLSSMQQPHSTFRSSLRKLGIPKILGFDFMIDSNAVPKLLEVNRFPGLEARGDGDRHVKDSIIRGAWTLAAQRIGRNLQDLGLQKERHGKDIDLATLFEEISP